MEITTKKKITKERKYMKNYINKLDRSDIYGTLHIITVEYTFLSSAPGALTR